MKSRKAVLPSFDLFQAVMKNAMDEGYPPAAEAMVMCSGETLFRKTWGRRYKYWDVASLTKIMGCAAALMVLKDQGLFELDQRVDYYLPYFSGRPVGRIPVRRLLNHTSGLPWHENYFEELRELPPFERREYMKRRFAQIPVKYKGKAVYSDPDVITLGWIIEEITTLPLVDAFTQLIFEPLNLQNTFFHPENVLRFPKKFYAPTERCPWRRRVLQGEVHDDNTWSFGGVSSHAGLFSTLDDVSHFGNELIKAWKGEGFVTRKTAHEFMTRATPSKVGDWALLFMLPSLEEKGSSAGTLVSSGAVGHTGYTGTSLWIDLKKEIVITILSNRVHPTRKDERFVKLRSKLHDAVWSAFEEKK